MSELEFAWLKKMIQQQIGDLLEIEECGKHYYVVVLTKIVMFGGNILFAFHNDGKKREAASLIASASGFNICADLLWPKRENRVTRLHRFEDVSQFWRSQYIKACNATGGGVKAKEWFIYKANEQRGTHFDRVKTLPAKYRDAMDDGCHSFDLVAKMVLERYTPDQNEHI